MRKRGARESRVWWMPDGVVSRAALFVVVYLLGFD